MEYTKHYASTVLIKKLLGNNIHFISDCMLFPKQGISGKVISYRIMNNGEVLFKVKTSLGKSYDVGTNTSNLQFEFI